MPIASPGVTDGVLINPCGLDRIDNIELVACLDTLGFGLLDCTRLKGDGIDDRTPQGRAMVAIRNGNRWALIPEDCSARVEVLAKRHLMGR